MKELRVYKNKDLVGKSGKTHSFSGIPLFEYNGEYQLKTKVIYYIGCADENNNVYDYFNLNISYDILDTFSYLATNLRNDDRFFCCHFFVYYSSSTEEDFLKEVLDDLNLKKYIKPIL